jgi:predicted transcriptional regulator
MVDWPGGKVKTVEELLPIARERLVTVTDDVRLIEVAKLLQAGADLVIVCDSAGLLAGVITKTDIVAQISQCQGANCITLMSRPRTSAGEDFVRRFCAGQTDV